MKLGNNKEFSSKDFIEFAKRGPKSAEEKQNIKKGLKKFWDKKGRAVMTVGAGAAALGGITLAAKSGKIPMLGSAKSMSNASQKTFKGKTYNQARGSKPRMGDTSAFNGGVDKQPRTINAPSADGNAAMVVKGASSPNIVSQVAKTIRTAGKKAVSRGQESRDEFDKGWQAGPDSDKNIGVQAAKGIKAIARRIKKARG